VKELGTEHLFPERLRQTAEWPALSGLAAAVMGSWRDALRGGYELEELPRGYLARYGGAPVAAVHRVADVSAFAKLTRRGARPKGSSRSKCGYSAGRKLEYSQAWLRNRPPGAHGL
jgi:hypothetical protein